MTPNPLLDVVYVGETLVKLGKLFPLEVIQVC